MLVTDPEYLGYRHEAPVIVQITLRGGRTNDQEHDLTRGSRKGAESAGIRTDDVIIVLHEDEKIDWSFGGGSAQYAPEG